MSRLIDANANREKFKEIVYQTLNDCTITTKKKFNLIMNAFDNMPTANIDKDVRDEDYNKGLEDGRNEVWEFVRKTNTSVHPQKAVELLDFFGVNNYRDIFIEYTPQEALAKLEAYEKARATFKRGDIVEFVDTDELATYIGRYADGTHAVVFNDCNLPQKVSTKEIRKTDKHIDIQGVLRQIGGGVNGNS